MNKNQSAQLRKSSIQKLSIAVVKTAYVTIAAATKILHIAKQILKKIIDNAAKNDTIITTSISKNLIAKCIERAEQIALISV